jgi:DNA mismatch repair protein MSH3
MVGEELDAGDEMGGVGESSLLCLVEEPLPGSPHGVFFGLVSVSLATGEIVYDAFEDDGDRAALSTRLEHIRPAELLVSAELSPRTKRFVQAVATQGANPPRVETIKPDAFTSARPGDGDDGDAAVAIGVRSAAAREQIGAMPPSAQVCLRVVAGYLRDFKLGRVLELAPHARPFSTAGRDMVLDGATVRNLELFENETNHTSTGSLFWVSGARFACSGSAYVSTCRQVLCSPGTSD